MSMSNKNNKIMTTVRIAKANIDYARKKKINLSQLLDDALRQKRYHEKEINEITYDEPECALASFDPTKDITETEKSGHSKLLVEPYDPFRGMTEEEKSAEIKRWNDERAAFESIYLDPNVVQLCETPSNNHGCRGYGVSIRITSDRTGTVIAGYGCSSCWQVGHDDASSPIPVGTNVELPESCASWDEASKLVGYSHNELIDDRDEPQPDTTRVTPYQLIK